MAAKLLSVRLLPTVGCILACAWWATAARAQPIPHMLNVQGVLRNAAGETVVGTYVLTFRIFPSQTGGTKLFEWTRSLTLTGGFFNVYLGPLDSNVFKDWPQLWLEVQVGTDPPLPRQMFSSVGYAFMAEHAAAASTLSAPAVQLNNHVTHLPWFNVGEPADGYVKLVTPIVDNESNMFSIRIFGYLYGAGGGQPLDVRCGGYANSGLPTGSALINRYCDAEGPSSLPVELATENRGGTNVVVIRLGSPGQHWSYDHFTAEYVGWQAKSPTAFQWVTGEKTPAPSFNANKVVIDDQTGDGKFVSITLGGVTRTSWPSLAGTGTANFIARWTSTGDLGDSSIFDNGKVGIGTSSPDERVVVDGNVRVGLASGGQNNWGKALVFGGANPILQGWDGENSDPLWLARYNAAGNASELRMIVGDDPGQAEDRFVIGACSGYGNFNQACTWAPKFTFTMAGALGIGVGDPKRKVHITGGSDAGSNGVFLAEDYRGGIAIRDYYPELDLVSNMYNNPSHGATLRLVAYDNSSLNSFKHWVIGTPGYNATWMDIGYAANEANPHAGIAGWGGSGGSGRTIMHLQSNGNVGIGTLTPLAKIGQGTLQNSLETTGWILASGSGGPNWGDTATRVGVVRTGGGDCDAYWMSANANGTFAIHHGCRGDRVTMDTEGRLGIGGLPDSSYRVKVYGDLMVTGNVYASGGGSIASGQVVQTVISTSDYKSSLNVTEFTEPPDGQYRISITPRLSNSKILVEFYFSVNTQMWSNTVFHFQIVRNIGTGSEVLVGVGPAYGSRRRVTLVSRPSNGYDTNDQQTIYLMGVDTGLTAGQTYTYGFKYRRETGGSGTIYFNYHPHDNSVYAFSGIMTMKLTEIAP